MATMRRLPWRILGLFVLPLLLVSVLFAARWWMSSSPRSLNLSRSQAEIWLGQQAQDAVEMKITASWQVPIYRGEKTSYAFTTNRQDIRNMLSLLKCSGALSGQKNIPPAYGLADYGQFFGITLRRQDGRMVYLTLCPGSKHPGSNDLVHFGPPSAQRQFLGVALVSFASYRAFSDAFYTLWIKTGKQSP